MVAAVASFGDLITVRPLMTRVIHLTDTHCDYQTATAVQQLTSRAGHDAAIRTIGRGGNFTTYPIAVLKLREQIGDAQLIHAWGAVPLWVAAMGSRRKIVYSPTHYPTKHDVKWLRAIMSVREVQVVCPTDTMRRAFVERGVPIERCHLIRPGVDFGKINRRRNDALRASYGFSPKDVVILACGESMRGANHHLTILTATVLNVYDPKFKLLLWGKGPLTESERKYCYCMLPPNFISIATDRDRNVTYEQLLPASDVMLITADKPIPTLPIAVCMAAGLPIVSTLTTTVAELLEDRHNALFTKRKTTRLISRRILDLLDDPQLQWQISDRAKTEAYEFFSMTRFVSQYREVYEQVAAGDRVELQHKAPGAGMRFMGIGAEN
jgi:glycosyltransferase involved in cell wall biosynthesis